MRNLESSLKEIRKDIKNWWVLLLLGILFIGMGIFVFAKPLESYVTLAIFFAVSMLVSGITQFWFAIANRKEIDGWGWQLALGIMEFIFGMVLVFKMDITMAILPFYVGFWLLLKSFSLIGISFELKSNQVLDWGYYLVFGLSLVMLSWFIILNPLFGGITIITWTGSALIVSGIAQVMFSFKLKKVNKEIVKAEEANDSTEIINEVK